MDDKHSVRKDFKRAISLAVVIVSLASFPTAHAQSGKDDDLRGANYVYPRATGRSRTAQTRAKYRRKGNGLSRPDVADARIGITLWKAEPARSGDPVATRDIVQAGGQTKAWSLVRIGADTPLDASDMFRVGVESLRSGYLYVVNRSLRSDGSYGDPYLIFPTGRIHAGDNRIVAGRMIMLPTPPDEPPFVAIDPVGNIVAEEMIVIVAPSPLDVATLEDRQRLDTALVTDWLTRWSAPVESFELLNGEGSKYTRAEKSAATNPARLLASGDPLPQIVHRVAPRPGDPLLVQFAVKVRHDQARIDRN